MRVLKTVNGLRVNAIAGTYVVLFGFDLPKTECEGLMGFSIHRVDHNEKESYYLEGMKVFEETNPGFPSGSSYSTKSQPIQSFQWADYSAKPGYTYTYTVAALKGEPTNLEKYAEVEIDITTESPESGNHDVYFNRGTAASQEYVRRFGDVSPVNEGLDDVVRKNILKWLSRGIYEALENYVNTCEAEKHSLRIAAYEFNYEPFLQLLKETIDRGVDIQIVYDARKESPKKDNVLAVNNIGLGGNCKPRTEGASYISHNKFIVKIENGTPISVWTGGMNFSISGIFGHSNVAHIVEEQAVAEKYLDYWELLFQDPKTTAEKKEVEKISTLPTIPLAEGSVCVFSPRKSLDALNLYSELAMNASNGLFMTFAFGINQIFKDVYRDSTTPLRFALLEKATRPMKDGPEKDAEEQEIIDLRKKTENVFAIGNFIKTNEFDGWLKERLTGLNKNVKYIHNKFMLVDPLSDSPIVVTGSANFSDASTINNDENMVIIKGNKRIADIYLGEYMRMFSHFSFRESLTFKKDKNAKPKYLRTDNWWEDYYKDNDRSSRRKFFARN